MSRKVVKITQNHIDRGSILSSTSCPAALALGYGWSVFSNRLIAPCGSYALPTRMARWISRFDSGRECRPATFHIESV